MGMQKRASETPTAAFLPKIASNVHTLFLFGLGEREGLGTVQRTFLSLHTAPASQVLRSCLTLCLALYTLLALRHL